MTIRERITDSVYTCVHKWLRKNHKKPKKCALCHGTRKAIEWANITGIYKKDIKNFKGICASCHRRMDLGAKPLHCLKGHKMTKENCYTRPRFPNESICRKCKNINHQAYKLRVRKAKLQHSQSKSVGREP